jgi:hypothetical protein
MKRRDFIKALGAMGILSALPKLPEWLEAAKVTEPAADDVVTVVYDPLPEVVLPETGSVTFAASIWEWAADISATYGPGEQLPDLFRLMDTRGMVDFRLPPKPDLHNGLIVTGYITGYDLHPSVGDTVDLNMSVHADSITMGGCKIQWQQPTGKQLHDLGYIRFRQEEYGLPSYGEDAFAFWDNPEDAEYDSL